MYKSSYNLKKKQQPICSFQYLQPPEKIDELLLSAERENIIQQKSNEDDTFELYVTPYSAKLKESNKIQAYESNRNHVFARYQEGTVKQSHNCTSYKEEEIERLKKIIHKKNMIISRLTEQLKNLSYDIEVIDFSSRKPLQRQEKLWGLSMKKEFQFLQKNNSELYEQMAKYKAQCQAINKQYEKVKLKIEGLEDRMKLLEVQNTRLVKINKKLTDKTQTYLISSQKQIQYVNKMREILATKTGLAKENIPLGRSLSKTTVKRVQNISQQLIKSERKQKLSQKMRSLSHSKNNN